MTKHWVIIYWSAEDDGRVVDGMGGPRHLQGHHEVLFLAIVVDGQALEGSGSVWVWGR